MNKKVFCLIVTFLSLCVILLLAMAAKAQLHLHVAVADAQLRPTNSELNLEDYVCPLMIGCVPRNIEYVRMQRVENGLALLTAEDGYQQKDGNEYEECGGDVKDSPEYPNGVRLSDGAWSGGWVWYRFYMPCPAEDFTELDAGVRGKESGGWGDGVDVYVWNWNTESWDWVGKTSTGEGLNIFDVNPTNHISQTYYNYIIKVSADLLDCYDVEFVDTSYTYTVNTPPNEPSNPSPSDGETSVDVDSDLSWSCSDPDGDSLTYDVYFGTSSNPPKVASDRSTSSYDPGTLSYGTTYYWKIVAKDDESSTPGPVWSFTTREPRGKLYVEVSNNDDDNHAVDIYVDGSYWSSIIVPSGGMKTSPDKEVDPDYHTVEIKWYDADIDKDYSKSRRKYVGSGERVKYPFDLDKHLSPVRVRVKNVDGATTSGAEAHLWGPGGYSGSYRGSKTTDSNGYTGWWSDLSDGDYITEVYYAPGVGLNLEEFWGGSSISVGNEGSITHTFVRHTQWVYDIKVNEKPLGQPVIYVGDDAHVDVTVKNSESAAHKVKARVILDRDKSAPYDFDETHGPVTINAGAYGYFGYDYKPKDGGTYYIYVVAKGYYNEKYTVTDQWDWTEAFLVKKNRPPNEPSDPIPSDGDIYVNVDSDLSWSCSDPDGDSLTYDVYFGTSSNPPKVASDKSTSSYDPGTMSYGTTYYWKIVAKDGKSSTSSGIWNFTTIWWFIPPYGIGESDSGGEIGGGPEVVEEYCNYSDVDKTSGKIEVFSWCRVLPSPPLFSASASAWAAGYLGDEFDIPLAGSYEITMRFRVKGKLEISGEAPFNWVAASLWLRGYILKDGEEICKEELWQKGIGYFSGKEQIDEYVEKTFSVYLERGRYKIYGLAWSRTLTMADWLPGEALSDFWEGGVWLEEINIRLPASPGETGSLTVSAYDSGGAPIDGTELNALVVFQDTYENTYEIIDPTSNSYTWSDLPAEHRYLVEAYINDMYSGSTGWIPIESPGVSKSVSVTTKDPGLLKVKTTFSDCNTPLPNAYVEVVSHEGTVWRSGTTDSNGETTWFRLQPTTKSGEYYQIYVFYNGEPAGESERITLSSNTNKIVEVCTTVSCPPNAPTLNSPREDARHDKGELVSFDWTFNDPNPDDSQGAYTVQIDNDYDFSSPEVDTKKLSSSTTQAFVNMPNSIGEYWWRVKTWDEHEVEGPWSSARRIYADIVKVIEISADDSRRDIGTWVELSVSLKFASDNSDVTSGSFSIDGVSLSHSSGPYWTGKDKEDSVTKNVYDSVSGYTDHVDKVDQNGKKEEVIWDRIEVYYQALDDNRVDINTKIEFRVRARLDYDNHPLGSEDLMTANFGSLSWDSGNAWFDGTRTQGFVGDYTFTVSSGSEATYGITSVYVSVSNPTGIWDRIHATACDVDDERIDVDTAGQIDFTLKYDYDEMALTDGSVSINGESATHQSSGVWRITPVKSSVQKITYGGSASISGNTYGITVYDQNGQSGSIIWDKITVRDHTCTDTRVDVGTSQNLDVEIEYEYDDTSVTDGTVTINNISASHQGSGIWRISPSEGSVTDNTYDTVACSDNRHGITAVDQNGKSTTIIWDRIKIYYQHLDDSRVNINDNIEYRVKGRLDYDNHPLGSGDTVIANAGTMTWDSGNGWFDVSKSESTVTDYTFSVSSASEATYGITTIDDAVSGLTGIWDKIVFKTGSLETTDDRVNYNKDGEWYCELMLDYDGTEITSGTVNLNIGSMTWNPGESRWEYTYCPNSVTSVSRNINSVSNIIYGITALDPGVIGDSESVIYDRIIVSWSANTTTPNEGEGVRITFDTVTYDYDDSLVSSYQYDVNRNGTLFIDNGIASYFEDSSDTTVTYVYELISFQDVAGYGITAFVVPSNIAVTWSVKECEVTFAVTTASSYTDLDSTNYVTVTYVSKNLIKSVDIWDGYSATVWCDVGSIANYSNPSSGSTLTHRWQSETIPSYQITGSATYNPTYYEQFECEIKTSNLILSYPATIDVVQFGTTKHPATHDTWSDWVDTSSTLIVSSSISVSPHERYHTPDKTSWYVDSRIVALVDYYHQWKPNITLHGTDSTHTVTATYTEDGNPITQTGQHGSWSDWCDNDTDLNFSKETTGGSTTERWYTYSTRSWKVTEYFKATVSYQHQFYLALATNPLGVTISSGDGWYNASTYASVSTDEIVDNPSGTSRYKFKNWTTADMSEISDPSSTSTTVLMDKAKTVTANYATQFKITFDESGVGSDFLETIVVVDGVNYEFSSLPMYFWWDKDSEHNFTFVSPLTVDIDKQYVWASTSGLSNLQNGTLTITDSGNVTGNYNTQFSVVFDQTGLDTTANSTIVTVNGTSLTYDDLPHTFWVNSDSKVNYSYSLLLTSTVYGKRFALLDVVGPTSPVKVTGPARVIGNYEIQCLTSFIFKLNDGSEVLYTNPTQIKIQGASPNNTLIVITSYSDVWLDDVEWEAKEIWWQANNVVPESNPRFSLTPNGIWNIPCRVYKITSITFNDHAGTELYKPPAYATFTAPNGTDISLYSFDGLSLYLQYSNYTFKTIFWQSNNVVDSPPQKFDPTNGNPSINCRVYSFQIICHDNSGDPLSNASLKILCTNSTLLQSHSRLDGVYAASQIQNGTYSITVYWQDINVNSSKIVVDSHVNETLRCPVYSLTVCATDENGDPLSGANLSLYRNGMLLNGRFGLPTLPITNATGCYTWHQLSNQVQRYKVKAVYTSDDIPKAGWSNEQPLTKDDVWSIQVEPIINVDVKTVDWEGGVLSNAYVEVIVNKTVQASGHTDPNGWINFTNIVPGNLTFNVYWMQVKVNQTVVNLASDSTMTLRCKVYNVVIGFRDADGNTITNPSEYTLILPNGAESLLETFAFRCPIGSVTLKSAIWQGSEVAPLPNRQIIVNASKQYFFRIDVFNPTFYVKEPDGTTPFAYSTMQIELPNGTVRSYQTNLNGQITLKIQRGFCYINITTPDGYVAQVKYPVSINFTKTYEIPTTQVIINQTRLSDEDHRCDVGSTQTVYFHAKWVNGSNVVDGSIYINGVGRTTNGTGWISISMSSDIVDTHIWTVTSVDCYDITFYDKFVDDPSIIWDRIKIIDGGVTRPFTNTTNTEIVWFKAVYESDETPFDGSKGTLYVNGSKMSLSTENDRWERAYTFDTVGKRTFQITNATDDHYGLTVINDLAGLQNITWIEVKTWIVTYEGTTYNISVVAHSHIEDFNFDPVVRQINVTATGQPGTTGCCNITLPKQIVDSPSDIRVYIDRQETDFTLNEDVNNYYVYVEYEHSSHLVEINFAQPSPPPFPWWWLLIAIVVVIAVVAIVTRRGKS